MTKCEFINATDKTKNNNSLKSIVTFVALDYKICTLITSTNHALSDVEEDCHSTNPKAIFLSHLTNCANQLLHNLKNPLIRII